MADSDPFNVPPMPEQDQSGGDALPTYDDLVAQHGPNSRFGRWRAWIEKRAAERYADLTPADLERRRQKGWGEGVDRTHPADSQASSTYPSQTTYLSQAELHPSQAAIFNVAPSQTNSIYAPSSYGSSSHPTSMYSTATSSYASLQSHPIHPQLHLQTNFPLSAIPVSPFAHTSHPPPPAQLLPEAIDPSRLKLYNFGSRFLPHTTSPIRCLLPLGNHHMLLIGHDDGLSVLDMFPCDCSDEEDIQKGPADAEARVIWEGEGVHQMSILESESTGEGTPQGVVLALVSTESDSSKDQESPKVLRMYNLASLVSLAKWAVTQKDARPLDLHGSATGKHSQGSTKKHHRPPSSIAKGLKNLVLDPAIAQPQSPSSRRPEPQASYSSLTSSWTSPSKNKSAVTRTDSVDSDWDIVSDLPLRWATHFTPLASAGSRLQNSSVLFYDIWRNEAQRVRGGTLLAVATKSSILLYEAPKGERAFRLAKEFYTPLPARSITFCHQSVQDNMGRSPSDVFPRSAALDSHHRHTRVSSFGSTVSNYPTQLSLFVVFEKKAGTIRIADSAVGEVDLYEDNWGAQQSALMNASPSTTGRRSRASWDGRGFAKEKGPWVRPVMFSIPGSEFHSSFAHMYVLTRGRQSHIVPHPLPAKVSTVPPYRILYWSSTPNSVGARVCTSDNPDEPPFLQVIAFGEDGVEVQEVPLSQLSERKGKSRAHDPVRAQADIGGSAGLLGAGGHWNRPFYHGLSRSYSTSSYSSYDSTTSTEEGGEADGGSEGIYAWVQKGAEDWRVVWLGDGAPRNEEEFYEDDVDES
ncbi:hypothetical protein BN946_scf185015.g133 [Trametes cinnabarina]|uniref:Uncharacterized protein n=1 Tax=Pycnoporus cinnabarinus TaxID=5643 RepID=A0A060SNP3_PYCCI|nr:hypothetical protein BN946_scf185015.g133 [Trametes cinnabarina]